MVIPCTFAGAPWTAKPAFEYNFAQLVFAHAILYVRAHFSGMQAAPLTKIMNLKPNVIPVSRQLSFSKACEFQVFTPPKFCLSRRRCVAISGVTRTPEIGARIQASGCWAAIGVSLHLLFLCSEMPTHLLGVGAKKTKIDQKDHHHRLSQRWIGAPC